VDGNTVRLFRFVDSFGNIISKTAPLLVHLIDRGIHQRRPVEPHTVTFGCPTDDPACPVGGGPGAFVDISGVSGTAADGARSAVLNAGFDPRDETQRDANPKDGIKSRLLIAQVQDRATGVMPLSGTPGTSVPIAQASAGRAVLAVRP
jgi:hypothetical protein